MLVENLKHECTVHTREGSATDKHPKLNLIQAP